MNKEKATKSLPPQVLSISEYIAEFPSHAMLCNAAVEE
jgi:hypothetical protein